MALKGDIYHWEPFKAVLSQLYGNTLSKEDTQQQILSLRHSGTIDEYINENLVREWDPHIGP